MSFSKDDFNAWLNDFCARFPDCHTWINALPNRSSTLATWLEWFTAQIDDRQWLMAANVHLQMHGGIRAFEREQIPAIVLKRAKEIRHSVSSFAESQDRIERKQRDYTRSQTAKKAWAICEGYLERKKAGWKKQELESWLTNQDREVFG